MKRYLGERLADGRLFVWVEEERDRRPLNPRFDLKDLSRTGFECGGTCESGADQLALALLCDHTNDRTTALAHYQSFRRALVDRLNERGFTLTPEEIQAALVLL